MPSTKVDHTNKQGGKQWGKLKKDQEEALEAINEEIIKNGEYSSYEDLEERLNNYKDRKRIQEDAFAAYNKEIITSGKYSEDEYPDLEERLVSYKGMFMEFDENSSGDIDIMELKRMMEKLGQAKTHLELKKMITEVDTTNSGTIHYNEFIEMMLGKRNSILKLILMFEEKKQEKERPTGNPPKRDLEHLP